MSAQPKELKNVRRVTCVGFDWRAEVSLKETLSLLRGKTSDIWQYSDELTADVVVYDSRNALAQAMVRREAGANGSQVFFTSDNEADSELSLRYPFGASRLIRCLDHASQRLAAMHGHVAPEAGSLCQRIDDALRVPGLRAVAITAGGHTGLLKPEEQKLWWPQPMELDETAKLLSGSVEVQALVASDAALLARLEAAATVATPAEGLLWAIGIARSRGVLLNRIDPARQYRLRRWPNFGAIGRRSADLRCASLLIQREMTQASLSMLAAIPASVIVNFMNACAICGLLVEGEAPSPVLAATSISANPLADSRLGGMLRRIRQAFTLE